MDPRGDKEENRGKYFPRARATEVNNIDMFVFVSRGGS